ncbi:sugar transferase [Sphingomonas bacterium]|uniref:sugar transferase n=1 Tax=Sphingomonas bacterium TaxID=1895847 RepID=UPI0020C69B50|nr:sugar transferase [Sphingomonas bacterium]
MLDISASLALLLFLAPLLLLVAALVFITDPGPMIFGHRRIGQYGRQFRCFKFRSMVVDAEARLEELLSRDADARLEWERDHKLRSDPRITMIGNFLRRTSLDELPQLFNVLRGEMSLVGPRPIVEAEVRRYGRYFGYYKQVRPGITGLWQVSGRSNTSYRRRVALDVKFAKSQSVRLYVNILLKTVPSVLLAKGSC